MFKFDDAAMLRDPNEDCLDLKFTFVPGEPMPSPLFIGKTFAYLFGLNEDSGEPTIQLCSIKGLHDREEALRLSPSEVRQLAKEVNRLVDLLKGVDDDA